MQRSVPDARVRIMSGIGIFALLLAVGTVGYMIIDGWSFMDSLFMTVTTVTTVGYREIHPLDTPAASSPSFWYSSASALPSTC